jgi:NAD(P)-dependent dehydrogenase (short-subunit alcohol dehydrogenase family)
MCHLPVGANPPLTIGETRRMDDPLERFRLDGQVALVTGASAGLGARFARVLHAVGATVVLTARRADRLEALAAELPGSIVLPADIGDAAERERLVADALDRAGRIDVLVNNAGVSYIVGIEHETLDQFESAMRVNTTAVWHLIKLCTPHMTERGSGSIVNIASMLGLVGATPVKQANYCASKGAVVNMTRELALQLARKGVRVNALCPGYFPSEMTETMIDDEGSDRYIRTFSAIPRMGRDHELDGALLLLASAAGSFITGHALVVDGGFTAH